MGSFMSFMGKGLPSMQMPRSVTDTLVHDQFIEKEIKTFEDFHMAMLDIFNNFNSAVPGKHYDVPPRKDVQECFEKWNSKKDEKEKKNVFVEFMMKNVNTSKLDDSTMISKLDDSTIIAGVVTPPVAMALKRAGENVPQINRIKIIPDVIFVPSATLLALVSVKITQRLASKKTNHGTIDVQNNGNQGQSRNVNIGSDACSSS